MPAYQLKDAADMAQNGEIVVDISRLSRPVVSVQTGPANNAGAAVAIQGRVNSDGSWITLTYTKPDATTGNSLVGVDKLGTVDSGVLGACTQVRATRTDANGGVCQVYLGVSSNN